MKVEFELWQLITLTLTIVGLFVGAAKLLFAQFARRIDERFTAMTDLYNRRADSLEEQNNAIQRFDRDLLALRVELAERYVKREDYIRGQTIIESKLDAIASELKNVQIRQGAV